MKPILLYLALVFAYFLRQVADPYIVSGASEFVSQFIITGLFNGIFISFIGLFVVVRGKFKTMDILWAFLVTLMIHELHGFTSLVKAYEYFYEGHLPMPYEEYHVAAHNIYIVLIFVCLAACLLYVKFAPNHIRKIMTAPVLVVFMGCNFYHYFQFFFFTNDLWNESRDNALEYVSENIATDQFLESCKAVDGMSCVEWKDGDPFPDDILMPASHILHEIRDAYENQSWASHFRFQKIADLELRESTDTFLDGQIDNTFDESFWATINLYINKDTGVFRVATYDHILMVHIGSVPAGIALTIASVLWMCLAIFLATVHPTPTPRDSRWMLAIAPVCLLSLILLNLKPLHEYYPYFAAFFGALFVFPLRKDKLKKVALALGITTVVVLISGFMFTKVQQSYMTALIFALGGVIAALWYSQTTHLTSRSMLAARLAILTSIACPMAMMLTAVHVEVGVAEMIGDYISVATVILVLVSLVSRTQFYGYVIPKYTGEEVILYVAASLGALLSILFSWFMVPFFIDFVSSTSELGFNVGRMDSSSYNVEIFHFYTLVVVAIMSFAKLFHFYLRKRHTKHSL